MAKTKGLTFEEKLKEALIPKEEQPYEIPENWEWVKLGSISKMISKGTTPKGGEASYKNIGVKFLRVENISNDYRLNFSNIKFIDDYTHNNFLKRSILMEHDILISIAGTLGRTAIVKKEDIPMNINQAICFIRLINSNKISSEFFCFLFNNSIIKSKLLEKAKTTAIPNLTLEIISNSLIPLPPLEEQKRIVEKLDFMFEKINKAKELIQEAKENIESRKESILNKAFRGELTVKWRKNNQTEDAIELLKSINEEKVKNWEQECIEAEKNGKKKPSKAKIEEIQNMIISKEEEPYEVPKNWKWVKLGKITNIISGGTPSTEKKENYENGTIPWITPKDLSKYKSKYILSGNKNITELGLKNSSARLLPKNSVLLSSRAPIGYVVICKQEVATNQGFKSFEPSFLYIPEFLYYYLLNSKGYLESIATGTTFKELSGEKVKTIYFPLPPLEEQKEIVRILDEILEKESKIKELIELEEAIELLEKSILDKAFRGKLGTQNKDDEPAIELLKKYYNLK